MPRDPRPANERILLQKRYGGIIYFDLHHLGRRREFKRVDGTMHSTATAPGYDAAECYRFAATVALLCGFNEEVNF